MKQENVAVTGTAQETDTNKKEDSHRKRKISVSHEIDFTFEICMGNPNIDGWCDRAYMYEEVKTSVKAEGK